MTSYTLGRHYDLVWDAIMTEYPGTSLRLVSWDAIMTSYLGRHYELVSWDAIMTSYPGTPL